MNKIAILYYSSCTEEELLENKIRQNIIKNKGNLELVSVTQKPLNNFGKNINVGKHDNCYANEFRQIQIGLQEITSQYVLVTEADCLYPPEYFHFNPQKNADYYRFDNVWVHTYQNPLQKDALFYFKGFSDCAQLINRNFWLKKLDECLNDRTQWSKASDPPPPRLGIGTDRENVWTSQNPVITFKTNYGVSRRTEVKKNVTPKENLPFWGSAQLLRKNLFL